MPENINVLMLASGDLWAGAEKQVFLLAQALSRTDRVQVTAVLLNNGILADRLRENGISTEVFDESHNGFFTILFKLINRVRTSTPHIIHSHRKKENLLGALASLTSPRCRSVSTVHGGREQAASWRRPLHAATEYFALRIANLIHCRIFAVSEQLAEQFRKYGAHNKTVVVENCIDTETLRTLHAGKAKVFTVGIVGRLTAVKRIDIFLRVAARFIKSYEHPCRFLIVGDGECRDDLQNLAGELGIDKDVEFTGFRQDVYSVISELSAVLITSDHEGMPTVAMEALAIGIPVIAHSVGEIPAILEHGRFGELISNQEENLFCDTLLRHAHNPADLKSRAAAGREFSLSMYAPARTADACISEYMRCIDG